MRQGVSRYAGLMLPIIRADGSAVTDFTSTEHWKQFAKEMRPLSGADFITEPHHMFYGRPWITGRYHFDAILSLGLDPTSRVLDLGCGAGRTGVWLIRHLRPRRYHGIEAHLGSLIAFADYECPLHGLEPKQPRLMHDDKFGIEGFGVRFDVALDLYMTPWMTPEATTEAFSKVARQCRPGARLIMANPPKLSDDEMEAIGWRPMCRRTMSYPLLRNWKKAGPETWSVYGLI